MSFAKPAESSGRTSTPDAKSLSLTSLVSSAASETLLNVATIGCGIPAGPTIPYHATATKPGKPASAIVGMSGSDGERCGAVTPKPLSLPDLMNGIEDERLAKLKSTCPPSSPVSDSVAPLNGTWTVLMPAMLLKSSPERCTEVPAPELLKLSLPGLAFARAISSFTE